tara:strand:+ start:221 stop:808 length:588 start_codon:yes stop_codon:yes gene_type:complete
MTLILSICLNIQLGYSQSSFRGKPCDDTEVRNYAGLPAWKNYGEWLSECDSLADAYEDSIFAAMSLERKLKEAEEKRIRDEEIASIDVDVELDMEDMWAQAEWEEITEIMETESYEVENITAVAGVRGAEAEDEALAHLYYRKSMKGISQADYRKAYGKLKNKRDELFKNNPNHPKLRRIENLLLEVKSKIDKKV